MPRQTTQSSFEGSHQRADNPQDPSALTTSAIMREQWWSREVNAAELAAIRAELAAAAKAVNLLQDFANRTPTTSDVDHKVNQLREVIMARLDGVRETFAQNAIALSAALQAQEKQATATNTSTAAATQKMEEFFTKQIDALHSARKDDSKVADDKLGALGNRVTIIESRTSVSDPSMAIKIAELGKEVSRLTSGSDVSQGRSAGSLALWSLVVSGFSILIAVSAVTGLILKFMGKG